MIIFQKRFLETERRGKSEGFNEISSPAGERKPEKIDFAQKSRREILHKFREAGANFKIFIQHEKGHEKRGPYNTKIEEDSTQISRKILHKNRGRFCTEI